MAALMIRAGCAADPIDAMLTTLARHGDVPAPSAAARVGIFARDIKVSHSVFALPFALLATFLAAGHESRVPGVAVISLIVLCMVLARTTAMAANRLIDARLDVLNPRTAGRAVPSGRLTRGFVHLCLWVCVGAFIAATSGFWLLGANAYPLVLSPLVLAWLVLYSFTKRWTWCCHLFLGSALALSPVAAVIAVAPAYLYRSEPYLLAVMVVCWVGGFDIIYALQDVNSDRQTGVFSLPARKGVGPALWASRVLHGLAVVALVVLWNISPMLGGGFALAIFLVAGLLVLEHALVWGSKTKQIHLAFFTVNGVISLLLGALGIVDVVRAVA